MLRALYESLGAQWQPEGPEGPWRFGPLQEELETLEYGAALLDFSEYGVIAVGGADRKEFLHNQCTSEIKGLPEGAWLETLFLNNRGQIEHTGLVFNAGERLIVVSRSTSGLAARFRRYIIFDQVQIEEVPERLVLRLQGHGAAAVAQALGEIPGRWSGSSTEPNWLLRDEQGLWLLPQAPEAEALVRRLMEAGARLVGRQAWLVWRVEQGVPDLEEALGELPQEVGWEGRVNFKKGCYLGQEIMARLEARGNPRHELMALLGQRDLRTGAEVFRFGKPVGKVGTAVESPSWGAIALGVLRKELRPGDQVEIEGWSATVARLPLDSF
ncbi:MAG: folate-binding protein [Thermaceae bacterium]|nr:folate-binding protein [Thermaceae bacterium]